MIDNDSFQLLRDWEKVDTSLISTRSDKELYIMLENMYIKSGWGLVAELMKRYESKTAELKKLEHNYIDMEVSPMFKAKYERRN